MSSKTKIVVLHMKEIIYTIIFVLLAFVLIFLLYHMFHSKKESPDTSQKSTSSGTYTSDFFVGNSNLQVEVTVDGDKIIAVRFANMDDTISAMYPLLQPSMEEIAQQVIDTQGVSDITYSSDNAYTSQAILNAIDEALEQRDGSGVPPEN